MKEKSRYEKRRALGLCVSCPKPAEPGRSRCAECLVRNARDVLRRYHINPWVANDTEPITASCRCSNCGELGHSRRRCKKRAA